MQISILSPTDATSLPSRSDPTPSTLPILVPLPTIRRSSNISNKDADGGRRDSRRMSVRDSAGDFEKSYGQGRENITAKRGSLMGQEQLSIDVGSLRDPSSPKAGGANPQWSASLGLAPGLNLLGARSSQMAPRASNLGQVGPPADQIRQLGQHLEKNGDGSPLKRREAARTDNAMLQFLMARPGEDDESDSGSGSDFEDGSSSSSSSSSSSEEESEDAFDNTLDLVHERNARGQDNLLLPSRHTLGRDSVMTHKEFSGASKPYSALKTSEGETMQIGRKQHHKHDRSEKQLLAMMSTQENAQKAALAMGSSTEEGHHGSSEADKSMHAVARAKAIQHMVLEVANEHEKCHEKWKRRRNKKDAKEATKLQEARVDNEARKHAQKLRHKRGVGIAARLKFVVKAPPSVSVTQGGAAVGDASGDVVNTVTGRGDELQQWEEEEEEEEDEQEEKKADHHLSARNSIEPPSTMARNSIEPPSSMCLTRNSVEPAAPISLRVKAIMNLAAPAKGMRSSASTAMSLHVRASVLDELVEKVEDSPNPFSMPLVFPLPGLSRPASESPDQDMSTSRLDGIEPAGTRPRTGDSLGGRSGHSSALQAGAMLPFQTSQNRRKLPEIPRLRTKFRDKRMILSNNYGREACTLKRFHLQVAAAIGLDDDDLAQMGSIYNVSIDDLQYAAEQKVENERIAAATKMQRKWRSMRFYRSMVMLRRERERAVVRLQRWWSAKSRFWLPIQRRAKAKPRRLWAAIRLQCIARGRLVRSQWHLRREIHGIVCKMERLRADLGGDDISAILKVQAYARRILAYRKVAIMRAQRQLLQQQEEEERRKLEKQEKKRRMSVIRVSNPRRQSLALSMCGPGAGPGTGFRAALSTTSVGSNSTPSKGVYTSNTSSNGVYTSSPSESRAASPSQERHTSENSNEHFDGITPWSRQISPPSISDVVACGTRTPRVSVFEALESDSSDSESESQDTALEDDLAGLTMSRLCLTMSSAPLGSRLREQPLDASSARMGGLRHRMPAPKLLPKLTVAKKKSVNCPKRPELRQKVGSFALGRASTAEVQRATEPAVPLALQVPSVKKPAEAKRAPRTTRAAKARLPPLRR